MRRIEGPPCAPSAVRGLGDPPRVVPSAPRRNLGLYFVVGLLVALFQLFDLTRNSSSWLPSQFLIDYPTPTSTERIQLCRMEQFKKGTRKPHRLPKPPYNPLNNTSSSMTARFSTCYEGDSSDNGGGPNMNEPYRHIHLGGGAAKHKTCIFPRVMHNFRNEFCSLTKNKTVACIGDSLTLE